MTPPTVARPGYDLRALPHDALAAVSVTFLAVPQGLAYAMIAGLPPAMGLYAASFPVVLSSLLRSSRFVVSGPSNALSILVGAALVSTAAEDPVLAAATLAVLVGAMQITAGVLRLGVLVDYLSVPVVVGYVTGAATLIVVGQLGNLTGVELGGGHPAARIWTFFAGLGAADATAAAVGLGTAAAVVALRRIDERIPAPALCLAVATALSAVFELRAGGLRVVADLAPVPQQWPQLTWPVLSDSAGLFHAAVACTVLSLVESVSVARVAARSSGERLDATREFVGQGAANVAAGLCGAYPVSGSLGRTALNVRSGARTRVAGMLSGGFVLLALVTVGPALNPMPVAALAGLLLVVAADLVDVVRIRAIARSTRGDLSAFVATAVGTWVLTLDEAIYLGVGISVVLFLRRARLLLATEMVVDERGVLRELMGPQDTGTACRAVRVLHLEGNLFFGAAGELRAALDEVLADSGVLVILLRLKRTQGLDHSCAAVVEEAAERLRARGGRLLLAGLRGPALALLERSGAGAALGPDAIFPSEPGWFAAMERALQMAVRVVGKGEHGCGALCPLARRRPLALRD